MGQTEMLDKLITCRNLDGGLDACLKKIRKGVSDKPLRDTVAAFYPDQAGGSRTRLIEAHSDAMHDIGGAIVENLSLMVEEERRFSQLTTAAAAAIAEHGNEGGVRGPFTDAVFTALQQPEIDRVENAARMGFLADRLYGEMDIGAHSPSPATPHNGDDDQVAYYKATFKRPLDSLKDTAARYTETRATYAAEMSELLLNDASQMLVRSYYTLAKIIGVGKSDPEQLATIDASRETAATAVIFALRLYPALAPGEAVPESPVLQAYDRKRSGIPSIKRLALKMY